MRMPSLILSAILIFAASSSAFCIAEVVADNQHSPEPQATGAEATADQGGSANTLPLWFSLWERALWPITVLILAYFFRAQLTALAKRLLSAKFGENLFQFGEAPGDRGLPSPKKDEKSDQSVSEPLASAESMRVAHIFWLGHDLMWIQDAIYRGAPLDRIRHGLRQAMHHARSANLESAVYSELERIYTEVSETSSAEWDRSRRASTARVIGAAKGQIAKHLERLTPDFSPDPTS